MKLECPLHMCCCCIRERTASKNERTSDGERRAFDTLNALICDGAVVVEIEDMHAETHISLLGNGYS